MADKRVDRRAALNAGMAAAIATAAGALAACGRAKPPSPPAAPKAPADLPVGAPVKGGFKAVGGAIVAHPILLFCDLQVEPAREREMLAHFHGKYRPAAAKFEGFIDMKMLKLRALLQGGQLEGGQLEDWVNYRFQFTYQSHEVRDAWMASKIRAELWPGIENTLMSKDYHISTWEDA